MRDVRDRRDVSYNCSSHLGGRGRDLGLGFRGGEELRGVNSPGQVSGEENGG